ncbi:MAG: cadherin repeat domain-containing protein [Candidatus Caenarcaniphilales bacterium]|nr:cadherin repeat domain-containing protein [Candidatus Caenarcaniphilales bacterium]
MALIACNFLVTDVEAASRNYQEISVKRQQKLLNITQHDADIEKGLLEENQQRYQAACGAVRSAQIVNFATTGTGTGNLELSSDWVPENWTSSEWIVGFITIDGEFPIFHDFEIISGDTSKFYITSVGSIRVKVPLDYEEQTSYTLTVKVTASDDTYLISTFNIRVLDDPNESSPETEPETPSSGSNSAAGRLSLSSNWVPENWTSSKWIVGFVDISGGDYASIFSYDLSLVAGDTDVFEISSVGTLRASVPFDYETKSSYSVTVRATEPGGDYLEQTFSIVVEDRDDTDEPESPDNGGTNTAAGQISLSDNTVPENWTSSKWIVGFLDVVGGDYSKFSYDYTLVGGDTAFFEVSDIGTVRASVSFDYETRSSYSIRVRATEPDGDYLERTFAITVEDRLEAGEDNNDDSSNDENNNDNDNSSDDENDFLDFDEGNDFSYEGAVPIISIATLTADSEPVLTFTTDSPVPGLRFRVLNKMKRYFIFNDDHELVWYRNLPKRFLTKKRFINLRVEASSASGSKLVKKFKFRIQR